VKQKIAAAAAVVVVVVVVVVVGNNGGSLMRRKRNLGWRRAGVGLAWVLRKKDWLRKFAANNDPMGRWSD